MACDVTSTRTVRG